MWLIECRLGATAKSISDAEHHGFALHCCTAAAARCCSRQWGDCGRPRGLTSPAWQASLPLLQPARRPRLPALQEKVRIQKHTYLYFFKSCLLRKTQRNNSKQKVSGVCFLQSIASRPQPECAILAQPETVEEMQVHAALSEQGFGQALWLGLCSFSLSGKQYGVNGKRAGCS